MLEDMKQNKLFESLNNSLCLYLLILNSKICNTRVVKGDSTFATDDGFTADAPSTYRQ